MTLITELSRKLMADCSTLQQLNVRIAILKVEISNLLAYPVAQSNFQIRKRDLQWELDDMYAARSRFNVELAERYSDPEFRKQLVLLKLQDPHAYYWARLANFI